MNLEVQSFGPSVESSFGSSLPSSSGSSPRTYALHPSAKDGEFEVSPAVSQSSSSEISCDSAQLYPASCPLQSEVHGDPAKVAEGRSDAELSSDFLAEESESEDVNSAAGLLPAFVLEWARSNVNPTTMMIAQIAFLPKRAPFFCRES